MGAHGIPPGPENSRGGFTGAVTHEKGGKEQHLGLGQQPQPVPTAGIQMLHGQGTGLGASQLGNPFGKRFPGEGKQLRCAAAPQ